jgi:hypothetical protein
MCLHASLIFDKIFDKINLDDNTDNDFNRIFAQSTKPVSGGTVVLHLIAAVYSGQWHSTGLRSTFTYLFKRYIRDLF